MFNNWGENCANRWQKIFRQISGLPQDMGIFWPKKILSPISTILTPVIEHLKTIISWDFEWVLSSLPWDIEIQTLLSQRWANLAVFRFFAKTQEIDGKNCWKLRCEMQTYVPTNCEKIISNGYLKVSPWGGARLSGHPVQAMSSEA